MRPFRVFNRVSKVPIIWKVAGVRLGGVSQVAMLLTMGAGLSLVLSQSPWLAAIVFGTGFVTVVLVSMLLSRLDPDETMSDITAFGLLWRAMRHQYTANYDAFEN